MADKFFITDAFEKHADNLFLINGEKSITYTEFEKDTIDTLNGLEPFSILPGERVAVVVDNSYETILLIFALFFKGAIPVLLSERIPKLQVTSYMASIDCKKMLSKDIVSTKTINTNKIQFTELSLDNDATIMFTSGTSSVPKAVLHTFGNHYYSALGSNENITLKSGDRWLLSLPINHVGGLSILFRCLIAGATVVLQDSSENLSNSLSKYNITHLSLVETQLKRLLDESYQSLSLKAVLIGGGAVSLSVIDQAYGNDLPIYTSYGLTETTSQVTTTPPDATSAMLKTSGKVLPYREIKVADDSEILVKGETLCKSYLNAELPIDTDGWFHTGDLGCIDTNGYLIVTGRKDNMFISGGENIHPEQIESLVKKMPEIEQAVVIPKDDETFGQVPVLFYTNNKGQVITSEMLLDYLSDKLPKFQIPRSVYQFPETYKKSGIKPDRQFLKEWLKKSDK